MPKIVDAPIRTRNDHRTVTDEVMNEYIELMDLARETSQVVAVDDSRSDNYEKSYAPGERIRQAIYKRDGDTVKIKVTAAKDGEGMFTANISWK